MIKCQFRTTTKNSQVTSDVNTAAQPSIRMYEKIELYLQSFFNSSGTPQRLNATNHTLNINLILLFLSCCLSIQKKNQIIEELLRKGFLFQEFSLHTSGSADTKGQFPQQIARLASFATGLRLRCVLIWKHGWDSLCEVRGGSAIFAVKSHMFNFCEHPRNSWGCCEVWKQKTQVRNAPLFWRYSFGLTLLCERQQSVTCTITESSRMVVGSSSAHFPVPPQQGRFAVETIKIKTIKKTHRTNESSSAVRATVETP